MYHVPCTMYHVLCTMYRVPCTVYHVPCTMYRVPCTVYRVEAYGTPGHMRYMSTGYAAHTAAHACVQCRQVLVVPCICGTVYVSMNVEDSDASVDVHTRAAATSLVNGMCTVCTVRC